MASITKTASGYRAQVYVRGVRDSQSFRTKREADAWASARETELRADAGKLPAQRHTLRDALRRYAAEVSPGKRGRRWEELRLDAFERDAMLPVGSPLGSIEPDALGKWRDARLKRVTAGTVIREMGLVSAVLERARREWRWLESNPMRDVRRPRAPDHREVVITRAQVKQMVRVMGYRTRGRVATVAEAVAVCFLVALRTGMRAGELCGLTWSRVHPGYCQLPTTKTRPRDVPLTPKAMRLIERMRGFDPDKVFGIEAKSLDAMFRKYRQRAGLAGFTFHDSRHTAATWIAGRMNSAGIPAQQAVMDLCKMFGWRNMNQALVYYNPSAADIAKRIA